MSSPYARVKDGMRWMWSLADYTRLAVLLEPHAEALAAACALRPEMTVLDVAAGNGNFALAAARRGAVVTASDLSPHMVELGRERTAAENLDIEWMEADAEELPFPNDSFEVVASVFGAMFAPQPKLVAAELFRVARPGGLVAMANYGPGGFLDGLMGLMASFSAPAAVEMPSPFLWGDAGEVRRRFAELTSAVEILDRSLTFEFDSFDGWLEYWEQVNPPHAVLKAVLPPDGYRKLLEGAARHVEELNESEDGRVVLRSPYLLVLAHKP